MKSKYCVSRYLNIINIEDGKTSLLFNGMNGCIDEIPRELGDILVSRSRTMISKIPSVNIEFLKNRGHITTLAPQAELEKFKEFVEALHAKKINSVSTGGVVLLVSYNCNLSCAYCYQQEHRPHKSSAIMSEQLVEDIFKKYMPSLLPGIDNPAVYLYGGEPFLPANGPIIRKILKFAESGNNIAMGTVTNGTTVDKMLDIFGPGPGKINGVQISLDGAKPLHDKSRALLPDASPTFDIIIKNIQLLIKQDIQITLRINSDIDKFDTIPDLLAELKAKNILGDKHVTVYAYPLHANIAKIDSKKFLDLSATSQKICMLGAKFEHPSIVHANDWGHLFQQDKGIALTNSCYCMQTLQQHVVIDPFGDVYACTEEAGYPEFRIGHIDAKTGVEFFPLRDVYKTRHLANMPDCLGCSVALACGGQCGMLSRAKTGDLFKPYCNGAKEAILDSIKLAYSKKRMQSQKTVSAP
jgi:uncharacterized protein